MRESMSAALTWVRSNAKELGIDEDSFANHDIRSHVPTEGDSQGWAFGRCNDGDRACELLTDRRVVH